MSLANLNFFMSEAATNLRRSGMMSFITISTIGIALIMMGAFLLATMNMESFLYQMQAEALVTAYLKPEVSISSRLVRRRLSVLASEIDTSGLRYAVTRASACI